MGKARVLLLNPPTAVVSTEALLNLAYLAASLRKAGHAAKIIDATAPHRPWDDKSIRQTISDFEPHFIGVTLTIANISQTYRYLNELRKMKIPIVGGGPHANALPEEVFDHGADVVAIGEGEETIVSLAEYYLGNIYLKDIPGICFRDEKSAPAYTAPRKLIQDLDSIPFPDFSDFPIRSYTGSDDVNSNPIFWSVFSSRGCPFDCIFCSSHNVFGRTIRLRSARNVFEEIKQLHERFGTENITFQDDEILCSKKRFLELCALIIDSGLRLKMSIRTRIGSIDKDIIDNAKRAGITRISFGIESMNDDTLRKINKMYTVGTIREKFKLLAAAKFPYISFNNIVGWPWEKKKHFRKNMLEIRNLPKSIKFFTGVVTPIPYPKTQFYETYHKKYGFSGWWLNPDSHETGSGDTFNPFFLQFAQRMQPIYMRNPYWHYSRSLQKYITDFSWGVFSEFIKRHYRFPLAQGLILLCRLSHLLWRINPSLEKRLFSQLISSPTLERLKEKISFTDKY